MNAVSRTASVALAIAWLVFMFAGFRSNTMLRDMQRAPVSYCQSRSGDFQMVDMKGPACLESSEARSWRDNQRLLTAAGAIGAMLFIALFVAQLRSRRRKAGS